MFCLKSYLEEQWIKKIKKIIINKQNKKQHAPMVRLLLMVKEEDTGLMILLLVVSVALFLPPSLSLLKPDAVSLTWYEETDWKCMTLTCELCVHSR